MKLIKISHKLQSQFLKKLFLNETKINLFVPLLILVLIAAVIWIAGPYITWRGHTPLIDSEKRIYVILFCCLLWALKCLLFDLDTPIKSQYKNTDIQKKLDELQNRFAGAWQFLKKATIVKQNKLVHLNTLPWYVLIGPANAGKTSLLANSDVNFILQRQFKNQDKQNLLPSENCDWWVTREYCFVDIPGKYLNVKPELNDGKTSPVNSIIWRYLFSLIKKHRGKKSINGIIITLPLPELLQENEGKQYQLMIREVLQRLFELQKIFPERIPCQILITKCDLLPGFSEFFAETSSDEIVQSWGVTLTSPKNNETMEEIFVNRFNHLIKKLNQQLLWRLHQERNPMARPYIKGFPLQIERIKELIQNLVKKISSSQFNFTIQGVYLISALQKNPEEDTIIFNDINNSRRELQVFTQPFPTSRAFFIKHLLTHGFNPIKTKAPLVINLAAWKERSAYAASLAAIGLVIFILGKDFQRGVKQTYNAQNQLTEYKLVLQQFHNPDEHLANILKLLDTLEQDVRNSDSGFSIKRLFSFYSDQAQQKANIAYQQALQTILFPEIKNYLEDYLQNPVNKSTENIYSVLKTYLMLGDKQHFQADYIVDTVLQIMPKAMNKKAIDSLQNHLTVGLQSNFSPLLLNGTTIQDTRRYLTTLTNAKLSYVILKNIDSNNIDSDVTLHDLTDNSNIFTVKKALVQIPYMFTVKAFLPIFSQQTLYASQEATFGNWVLGNIPVGEKSKEIAENLAHQLRVTYVTNYISIWENQLANISLVSPKSLAQIDSIIQVLIASDSPLLKLLQTLHDNTYFEPISSSSPRLEGLGSLMEKNNSTDKQLSQIFDSLLALHQLLQSVITSPNERKTAFEFISEKIHNFDSPDAITQLRAVAAKSPEPVRDWLNTIANNSWHFLMDSAIHYIDTSWQDQVIRVYQSEIANRYPFDPNAAHEVDLKRFINFFGNPGVVTNFYNNYLRYFVDNSSTNWHWKSIDDTKLPFSEDILKQIQQAMLINHAFFPNGDSKLFIQFALQPYKFDKRIKSVRLSINDKQIFDTINNNPKTPHVVSWPNSDKWKMTSVQLIMMNEKMIIRDFPGDWGWFKFINQTFENAISEKQILLNLSKSEQPVRYLLFTQGKLNPFLSLNLHHFHLSQQLAVEKS